MVAARPDSKTLALWVSVSSTQPEHTLAFDFLQGWLSRRHLIELVFLHADAVDAAADREWSDRWLQLAPNRVYACSAACERRSIQPALMPNASLAFWMDQKANADRRVCF